MVPALVERFLVAVPEAGRGRRRRELGSEAEGRDLGTPPQRSVSRHAALYNVSASVRLCVYVHPLLWITLLSLHYFTSTRVGELPVLNTTY